METTKTVKTMNDVVVAKEDVVNEPSHYKHGSFEVIDEMILAFGPARTYDFCIMNAWKYRARAPFKGHMEQDMDKANRYLEMAKQIAEANELDCPRAGLIKCGRAEGESDGSGK